MTGLSLANLSVADAGPLELIDAASVAGCAGVNLWLTPPPAIAMFALRPYGGSPVVDDRALVQRIREHCDATGVRVLAASAGWIAEGFDPARIEPVLETCAALGTPLVALVGWDPDRPRLTDRLGLVCEAAARYGLAVGLEQMTYSAVATLADAASLVAAVGALNLGYIVDLLHVARSGGTADDLAALARDRVFGVQLCDAPAVAPPAERLRFESVNDRLHPGDGDLPLDDFLAALPKVPVVEIEVPCQADARLSIAARAVRCAQRARTYLEHHVPWPS